MKRISLILLAAIMLFNLAGCGSDHPDSKEENFSFTYNGIQITPGVEAAPVIDALGEPKSYTEEPSCAFDGMDKTYYYGPFYLATYPLNGKYYIYTLWFADDTVTTAEGIRIGSTRQQAEEAYGKSSDNGSNAFILRRGNSKLTVLITDGHVSGILYEANVD